MDPCQRARDVQSVAWRAALRLGAHKADPRRKRRELVGNFHEFIVELLVFHAFQHLVVPVQTTVEAIVGATPETFAEFGVVLPSLPCGRKESQAKP